jgi:glucans biosynthesis protein
VQLIEIPTDNEDFDNIVCMWVPKDPVKAGQSHDFRYRMHWMNDEPFPAPSLARATATRIGRGGFPYSREDPPKMKRFEVEFTGGELDQLPKDVKPEVVVTPARGTVSSIFVETTSWNKAWRIQFDLQADGPEPVDIRAYLKRGDTALSETWLFQCHPQQMKT